MAVKPPRLRILTPTGCEWRVPFSIQYIVYDDERPTVSVKVEYSSDGGMIFRTASEAVAHAASREGVSYVFVWEAADAGNFVVRLTPYTTVAGLPDACSFTVVGTPSSPRGPLRDRKQMSAQERRTVSERMKKYWASHRRGPEDPRKE